MDMSQNATGTAGHTTRNDRGYTRRITTETKSAYKTTEFVAYVAAVIGVLVASAMVDATDFGAQEAWFYISLLTIGYMVSRGLAKAGSSDPYDDHVDAR
jgi:hypothetical protein